MSTPDARLNLDPYAVGRRRAISIPGSEFVLEVDTVISAYGQYAYTS